MLVVQKFGGSSLADVTRLRRAAERIAKLREEGHLVVAVVSAQGDTTDHLLERIADVSAAPPAREVDACLAAGEQMSAALMAMVLFAISAWPLCHTNAKAAIKTANAIPVPKRWMFTGWWEMLPGWVIGILFPMQDA